MHAKKAVGVFCLFIVCLPGFLQGDVAGAEDDQTSMLSELTWLSGHWRGEAFGGITEEIWSPAAAGTMMCSFRLIVDGSVKFYEFVTITEEDGSLSLRLKHFNADLTGWEEKDEAMEFPFVEMKPDKVVFQGFVIERLGEDSIRITVQVENRPFPFQYKRVD